jgi:hypothetical protein
MVLTPETDTQVYSELRAADVHWAVGHCYYG